MFNGVINIYKQKGFTSHDVVAKMRGILKQKKIGHTGTLDPAAEGVLPVCLGSATKLCDMLTDRDKEYVAVIRLGIETDTQDMTGTILKENEVVCSEDMVKSTIQTFIGPYEQIPPMYSALKVNGQRLYDLARQGHTVEREPRSIMIHNIIIESISIPDVTIRVTCSKGTYIRTLCYDIGNKLGCGACMASLERTRSGIFKKDSAITLSELEQIAIDNKVDEIMIPVDQMFSKLGAVIVSEQNEKAVINGNRFKLITNQDNTCYKDREDVRVYNREGRFFGIYTYEAEEFWFHPKKMFF